MIGLLRRLRPTLRPLLGRFLAAVALTVLALASGAALLFTSAFLLSKAALRPGVAALQLGIVGVRFFGLSRGVLRYLERLSTHDVTLRLSAQVRAAFARALVPLSPARLVSHRGGDLSSRLLSDVEALENAAVRAALPLLSALAFAVLVASALPTPWLRAVLLVGLATAGVLAPALAARLGGFPSRRLVETRGPLEARLVDGVRGLGDLLVFGRARAHLHAVDADTRALGDAQVQVARAGALGTALATLAGDLTPLATLVLAVPLVVAGEIRGVYLAGLVLLALAAFEAVATLPTAFAAAGAARAGARRVGEILEAPPAVDEPEAPRQAGPGRRLEAVGLGFAYPGEDRPALEDVSLVVEPGRIVAIVGPSGSGKSTLAHLLVRFWDVPTGTLRLDGIDVRTLRSRDVRARVGLLSQRFHVFGATLRENLLLARPSASPAEVDAAARWSGLDTVAAALAEGWETFVGEQGTRLSGGQRQRLALAQTYLLEAPLLVFDEPTAHLDAHAERETFGRIAALAAGRGILVISHRLGGLAAADEILVLDRGRVRERGTFTSLARGDGFFARALAAEEGSSAG